MCSALSLSDLQQQTIMWYTYCCTERFHENPPFYWFRRFSSSSFALSCCAACGLFTLMTWVGSFVYAGWMIGDSRIHQRRAKGFQVASGRNKQMLILCQTVFNFLPAIIASLLGHYKTTTVWVLNILLLLWPLSWVIGTNISVSDKVYILIWAGWLISWLALIAWSIGSPVAKAFREFEDKESLRKK
jgi:hypothetical protein